MKDKMYFKGGSGIKEPKDYNGEIIKEGDILTHSYFHEDYPKFFKDHYPSMTEEEIFLINHHYGFIITKKKVSIMEWGLIKCCTHMTLLLNIVK